jgi:CheY-like chemotaxis protein/DNA-directed RNA polymerase specialized sigma24 family protein
MCLPSTDSTLLREGNMPLGTRIAAHLPYLRRYARALTGDQTRGDALVRATLEAALQDPLLQQRLEGGRVPLFRAFTQIFTRAFELGESEGDSLIPAELRLISLAPLPRQALLLTSLEEFCTDRTAEILDVTPRQVQALVDEALADIARQSATSVLIIEDEPLIAMQLEAMVEGMGHRLFGIAATRSKAQELVRDGTPGLVLADIQLADGSSGLDAVDDLLAIADVPVIFITAYPERLLTGNRSEPTWLVAKPFREQAVRAAIAQALFFRSPVTA